MKKFFQELGDKIMNAIGAVKAPENNDHSALMKAIGEAVSNTFKEGSDEMEASVKAIVNEAVKEATKPAEPTEDQKKAQEAAQQKAAADAETIKNLKEAVAGLEEDIKNIKGGKQTTQNPENTGKVAFGSFETK